VSLLHGEPGQHLVLGIQNPGGTVRKMPVHVPGTDVTVAEVVGRRAPKQCIDAHGPITRHNLSADDRVRPVGSDE